MTTLTNPITPQNIVDRFADFVTATANSSIVWGTNSKPFSEMPDATFGGTTSGKTVTATGNSIGATGTTITAQNIVNTLLTETALYTSIRQLRAVKNLIGAGIIYDSTNKTHLNTSYSQILNSVNSSNVSSGNIISSSNLETFFTNLQNEYNTKAANVQTIQIDVCHSSCHSSCHGSRGRR
jgi:hypothetical protein